MIDAFANLSLINDNVFDQVEVHQRIDLEGKNLIYFLKYSSRKGQKSSCNSRKTSGKL